MFTQSYKAISLNNLSNRSRYLILLVILTLMSVAGLIGSDVYLPALPTIGLFFNKTSHQMQLTLSIYLVGLSVSQLVYGPLSDRLGRKWLIVFGMGLYFLASMVCATASNYDTFVIGRFFQAVGACSGMTLGRAMIGDLFDAKEAAKVFSTVFPFVGMSPAISPVIGGFLTESLGWRATLVFIGLIALVIFMLVTFCMHETISKDIKQSSSIHPVKITKGYIQLLKQLKFWAYALVPCFAYIAYFAYIADSPFIFHHHGYGPAAIGCFYITLSLTYVVGNITGKRLLNFLKLNQTITIGYIVFVAGAAILLLSAALFGFTLTGMIAGISILTFGNGFLIPQGTAGVISQFQVNRGLASGLLGFLQLGAAASSAAIVGIVAKSNVLALGIYTFSLCLLGLILFVCLSRLATKLN